MHLHLENKNKNKKRQVFVTSIYSKKGNKHKVHVQSFEFYYFYTGNSFICDLGQGEIIWNLSLTDYRSHNSFQASRGK